MHAEITFDENGWFLVRAIADGPETFRFASTGPFYVEEAKQPQGVSRKSAKVFADWLSRGTLRHFPRNAKRPWAFGNEGRKGQSLSYTTPWGRGPRPKKI